MMPSPTRKLKNDLIVATFRATVVSLYFRPRRCSTNATSWSFVIASSAVPGNALSINPVNCRRSFRYALSVFVEAFFSTARKFKNWSMRSLVTSRYLGAVAVVGSRGGAMIGSPHPGCPRISSPVP